ncbi:MAG: hypothetical protein MUE53_10145 [Chitinophagales bacterium]|nr:hypothetical protein [Chitinophagales bacterium]
MNKTHIQLGFMALGLFMASCQQKEVDPAALDAKVEEAKKAKYAQIDSMVSASCEAKATAEVARVSDSLNKLSASAHAAAAAKMLEAKAKAEAEAKRLAEEAKKNAKPVLNEKGNQIGTAVTRGSDVKADPNIKLDENKNQVGTPVTR